MVKQNNETQIKGKKQLEYLKGSIKFDFEKERLEWKYGTVELQSKVVFLSTKVEKLEFTTARMEQYSRRNSILIHGLP